MVILYRRLSLEGLPPRTRRQCVSKGDGEAIYGYLRVERAGVVTIRVLYERYLSSIQIQHTHVGRTALNNSRSGIDEEKKQQPSNPVDTVRRHRHPSAIISVCTEQRFREKLAGQVPGRPLLKLCESLDAHFPRSFYERSRLQR